MNDTTHKPDTDSNYGTLAKVFAMKHGGSLLGFDQAARALDHYQNGNGANLEMSSDWLRSYESIQKAETKNKSKLETQVLSQPANQQQLSSLKNGQSLTLSGQLENKKIDAKGFTDLHYASGLSNLNTTATYTFTREGDEISVEVTATHDWSDPYDWENGTSFMFGLVTGDEMNDMKARAQAQTFNMVSSWRETAKGKLAIGANGQLILGPLKWDPVKPNAQNQMNAEHVDAFNQTLNMPQLNNLVSALKRADAPKNLIAEVLRGSTIKGRSLTDGVNPSLGAAIMHGIEGRSMVGKTLPGGFTSLERTASERARAEYERSGSVTSATQAAIDGIREAESYNGPSRDLSPEDTMSAKKLQDQLARNTAIREARARDLLSTPSVVISNIPKGAALSAGSTNQPSNALSQSQYAALQDRLAATLGNPTTAQSVWQGTTPERSTTADFHSRAA